ncbi:MAG: DUF756 domain-containing protein [Acidobacteriaceae bacterium]|nr:DUF756 domain-containing protein [Acidobacteriaceae bacterium]
MLKNYGAASDTVTVAKRYGGQQNSYEIAAAGSTKVEWPVDERHGWHDLLVRLAGSGNADYLRHFAGYVEIGKDSFSGPAIYVEHSEVAKSS